MSDFELVFSRFGPMPGASPARNQPNSAWRRARLPAGHSALLS